MEKEYKGVVVKESLTDPNVLKNFQVTGHVITGAPGDSWDLVSVMASLEDIQKLSLFIKDGPWYANFWNADQEVIAYKDNIFKDVDEARQYGLSVGVPPEQLSFKKD